MSEENRMKLIKESEGERAEILFPKRFQAFSITSLSIGIMGVGIFPWFTFLILTSLYYKITRDGVWIIMICFTILLVIGVVFSSISLRKGNKIVSIVGLIFNLLALGTMIVWQVFQLLHEKGLWG